MTAQSAASQVRTVAASLQELREQHDRTVTALGELDTRVTSILTHVEDGTAAVESLHERVDGLRDVIGTQADSIAALSQRLTDAGAAASSGNEGEDDEPTPPQAWSWADFAPGSDEIREHWKILNEWFDRVLGRWGICDNLTSPRYIAPCWRNHPFVVDELIALWAAWENAYHWEASAPTTPADWMDRYYPNATKRIRAELGGCRGLCTAEARPEVTDAPAPGATANRERVFVAGPYDQPDDDPGSTHGRNGRARN